jgi:hypothetical protein
MVTSKWPSNRNSNFIRSGTLTVSRLLASLHSGIRFCQNQQFATHRQPYVRLGSRAYGRIQGNSTSPYVKLKVADKEFDKEKVEEMPDMKEKVAAAMADKYWMDILIRHESHPMVARLVPEAPPPETSSH